MGLDPTAVMYHHHAGNLGSMDRSLSASQADQNLPDTLMTEMLHDNLVIDYGLPDMNMEMNSIGDNTNIPRSYTPPSNLMSPAENAQTDNGGGAGMNTGDTQIAEIGAGPLPAGFGAQPSLPSSSTVTDFTKRRNWPQKVIEEIKDFMHVLTPNGKIVYASPSCQSLTGYTPEELAGRFIVDFIHPDDSATYVREFNESIASGNALRFYYRFRKKDTTFIIFESHGHAHYTSTGEDFFMMARPYPTKNAVLLDSFLEHKIEFERMSKRIKDLKREEEEEEYEDSERNWAHKQPSESSDTITTSITKPDMSYGTLTKANLEDASSGRKPDSINDKMMRYEGVDRIQMLTGLQYREGERSQGISTGDHSPALIRGDAGIAIPVDKDGRLGDKKKKMKLLDEYVCTDCGTLDSPEWRKGPGGPKTLCNACGLRWAKKEKKQKPEPSNLPAGS
ncbi:hypothetical protein DID88_000574 [Monilinia fructigena]|uniref:White collar-2 n=1 Tax=Monilinia fructigena TaxID=38457 RepID=A0A395IKB1_9HELO|nr:hypothetical protein DID88_000574 [Monilinia fructigena]